MGTATILGTVYQTVIMPDGKEWMASNLVYPALGRWYNGGAVGDGYGRLYLRTELDTIEALLTSGWRCPSNAEWQALFAACGGTSVAGGRLKATGTEYWNAQNTGATDQYGFGLRGAGSSPIPGAYHQRKQYAYSWSSDSGYRLAFFESGSAFAVSSVWMNVESASVSIRLVRDVPYIPAESHETTHALALEWTEAADGTPVAYDDGAAYDYIESTITARMTPDELTALETAWQSSTKLYTIYSTGYLLGPLIDMSAGVEVRLMSYQVDQSADSSMTLYDVTIGVHYGPLSAPSAGSLAVVQSRGRPYHSVAPGAASWITDGGTSDVNAYGRASERSTTWYTHSLTTAQAADVVNALRTLRGSSTTWTAGGVATPWGPGESGTATVWIPEWSVHRESNLLWGVQMELVRNG